MEMEFSKRSALKLSSLTLAVAAATLTSVSAFADATPECNASADASCNR